VDVLLVGQPNVGKSVLFSRITGVRTIASNYPGTTVSYARGKMRIGEHDYEVVDAPGTYSLEPLDEASRVAVRLIDQARRIVNVVDSTHLERNLPFTLEVLAQKKPTVVALNMSDEAHCRGILIDAEKLAEKLGVPVVPTVARSGEGVKSLVLTLLSLPLPDVQRLREKQQGEHERTATGHPWHHPHLPHHTPGSLLEQRALEHDTGAPESGERARSIRESAGKGKGQTATGLDHAHLDRHRIWQKVGDIVEEVQTLTRHHYSFAQRLEELSVHPVWGSLIALLVLAFCFSLVRLIGEFLIAGTVGIIGEPWLEVPFGTELFFERTLKPFLTMLSGALGPGSFLHGLLIGTLINGEIDFMQSFGILTSGIFIPLGVVLPYLLSFYLVLSLLEDSGYLPRLAVFLDSIMHRLGLHGYAIIPTLLGLGCNVPGIMATRILETRRQRFITATLISIAVPCAALQAMVVGLVGNRGFWPLAVVYGSLFLIWLLIGIILRFVSRGFRPELLIEIPPYRVPACRALLLKLWMRISSFLVEALPVIIGALLVVNVLYQLEIFSYLAHFTAPVINRLWGMPEESIVPLMVGILRKDVALGMFTPLQLTTRQLIIGSVVLSMFFPCLATLVVLFRELGFWDGMKSLGIMLLAVIITGSALNLIL